MSVLTLGQIRIHSGSSTQEAALQEATDILVTAGAVTPAYVDAMRQREETVSTFKGNGLAIPHGTHDAKDTILASALSVVRYDGGVDWSGDPATFVIGIAGVGDEQLEILHTLGGGADPCDAVVADEQAGVAQFCARARVGVVKRGDAGGVLNQQGGHGGGGQWLKWG